MHLDPSFPGSSGPSSPESLEDQPLGQKRKFDNFRFDKKASPGTRINIPPEPSPLRELVSSEKIIFDQTVNRRRGKEPPYPSPSKSTLIPRLTKDIKAVQDRERMPPPPLPEKAKRASTLEPSAPPRPARKPLPTLEDALRKRKARRVSPLGPPASPRPGHKLLPPTPLPKKATKVSILELPTSSRPAPKPLEDARRTVGRASPLGPSVPLRPRRKPLPTLEDAHGGTQRSTQSLVETTAHLQSQASSRNQSHGRRNGRITIRIKQRSYPQLEAVPSRQSPVEPGSTSRLSKSDPSLTETDSPQHTSSAENGNQQKNQDDDAAQDTARPHVSSPGMQREDLFNDEGYISWETEDVDFMSQERPSL